MSVQAMSWVFEHSSAMWGARLVLLAIANHADKDGRNSWASVKQLASEAHLSDRQVQRALRELESTGEIVEVGVSFRRTHIYELPSMATLFSEGDILSPRQDDTRQDVTPDKMAGRHMRHGRVTSATPKGDTVSPEPSKNRPKNRPKERPASLDAVRLCSLLADLIEANGSKRPKVTDTWTVEADRLYRLDKRPPEEVERILRWCQADSFWRSNILSMPKFREKYDQLRLASSRTTERRYEGTLDRMAREAMEGMNAKRRSQGSSDDAPRALPR